MFDAFISEAKVQRDRAMGKIGKVNIDFINRAIVAIEATAARRRDFIVDQVWDKLREMDGSVNAYHPTDNRAMGVAMREARRLGIIRPSGYFRASEQPQCHSNPRRVWESLVYAAN
jgi:hypothetical protein